MFKIWKRLMAMVENKGRYYLGLAIVSLSSGGSIALMAYALKYFMLGAETLEVNTIYTGLLLMIIGHFAIVLIAPLGYWLYETSVVGGTANLRSLVFKSIVGLKTRWLDAKHSGDLTSRCTNDIQEAEKAYSQNLISLVELLAQGLISIALMFLTDWKLALPMIAIGLISVGMNRRLSKPLNAAAQAVQESLGAVTERVSDIANGNQVIRMFDSRQAIEPKFLAQNQDAVKKGLFRAKFAARINSFNTFNGYFSFLIVAMLGGILVLKGWYDFSVILFFIQLQNGVRNMFTALGFMLTDLQTSLAGGKRVLEIIDAPKEPACIELPTAATANEAAVKFEDITFSYNGNGVALESISLTVKPGETVALVGPSGGGKSTLFKLLLGYYTPEAGAISLLGRGLNEYPLRQLREQIAYVPQESYLFSGSIEENIGLGRLGADGDAIEAAAKAAYAHDFICEMPDGYQTLVGERGSHLSGGQRQRIAIARAILRDAPLLLLDEATSSLDAESEEQVQLALAHLVKGRTTLVIAHRLATIRDADRILVIADGKLEEDGSHQELFEANGLYRKLYDAQFAEDLPNAV